MIVLTLGVAAGGLTVVVLLALGRGERFVAMARDLLHRVVAPAHAGWTPLPTALHALEWRRVAILPKPERAGAFTRIPDRGWLAVTAHGDFYLVDAHDSVTRASIPPPINLAEFSADRLYSLPGLDRRLFRVNDIFAVPHTGSARSYDLYATHHYFRREASCAEWRLSRISLDASGTRATAPDASWTVMVAATPCVPIEESANPTYSAFNGDVSGGRMLLWDASTLMVTTGDLQLYEKSGLDVAQDPESLLGKVLLVDRTTGHARIFATGVRNPQGLWRDDRGRVWADEHGPRGGDELNLLHEGANYGWPRVSYGVHYDLRPWGTGGREGAHAFGVPPVFAFVPSLGISPLIQPDRRHFPNWSGDLIIGTLSTQRLVRVRIEGDVATYGEPISVPGFGFRDLDVAPDGMIVALSNNMELLYLRNAAGSGSTSISSPLSPSIDLQDVVATLPAARAEAVRAGAGLFASRCVQCHSLGAGAASGPSLLRVLGRRIAGADGFSYSPALARLEGIWTEDRLVDFLTKPDEFAPGQGMPPSGLSAREAGAVAAYLAELQRAAER